MISMHVLKLALNKIMRASDNEQGINKLRPKQHYYNKFSKLQHAVNYELST